MTTADLPAFNAALNASSGLLLVAGWLLVRSGRVAAHRWTMIAAFSVSSLFLASYLYYHAHHGSTRFAGTGWVRLVYFAVLLSHTVLAAAIVPLVLRTLFLAARDRIEEHRRIARWAMPLWLYVSATGVLVYWMLYRMHWR